MALSQSEQVRIADALVDVINAATWTLPLVAERKWLHDEEAKTLAAERRVQVIPPSDEDAITSTDINSGRRGHLQNDHPMRLVYQARVPLGAEDFQTRCDQESYTVETLWQTFAFDKYELTALAGVWYTQTWVTDAQIRKAYDSELLRQHGIFEAEVLVTVRIWRRS